MGFSSLFKTKDPTKLPLPPPPDPSHPPPPPRRWPSSYCRHPKTHSFRASMPLEQPPQDETLSCYTAELEEEEGDKDDDYYCLVDVKELRSDRLFFDPAGSETSSILRTSPSAPSSPPQDNRGGGGGGGGSVEELELESWNPYADFLKSVEEVVAVLGVRDRDGLAALLSWYLRANRKSNHVFILGAFVDLLLIEMVSMGSTSNSNVTTASCFSPATTTTSSSSSYFCSGFSSPFRIIKFPTEQEEEEEEETTMQ